MSIVIAVASAKGIIVVGDTRAINSESKQIVSESCKKVVRINENVLVGFTGTLDPFLAIYDAFKVMAKNTTKTCSLEYTANALSLLAKKYYKDTNSQDSLQMIFAGISEDNTSTLIRASYAENFELIIQKVSNLSDTQYAVLSPPGFNFADVFVKNIQKTPLVSKAIYNTIVYASQKTDTINSIPFGEQILR